MSDGKRAALPSDKIAKKIKTANTAICDCCRKEKEISKENFTKAQQAELHKSRVAICRSCWEVLEKRSKKIKTANTAICDCCRKEKEISKENFTKAQQAALRKSRVAICRSCWEVLEKRSKKIKTANTAICDCCRKEKEISEQNFTKAQQAALRQSRVAICRSCWKVPEKRSPYLDKTKAAKNKPAETERKQQAKQQEEELQRKRQEQKEREEELQRKRQEQKQREEELQRKRQERAKNRDELNRLLAMKPRKCCNCNRVKGKEEFLASQVDLGIPTSSHPHRFDEKYGFMPTGLADYAQQETIVVGKCLQCYPKDAEDRDIRRLKVKALDEERQQWRREYDRQVEDGELYYQYPDSLWDSPSLMSCSPENLVGVYDIVYKTAVRCDTPLEQKTVRDTTLTISQDGENLRGTVDGQWAADHFQFVGNATDFSIVEYDEYDWGGEFEVIPKGSLGLLVDRVACRWIQNEEETENISSEIDRCPVPTCHNVEEANAFLCWQHKVVDKNSWISNHLGLPASGASLVLQYAKAWSPPVPFLFFEKGDLRLKVVWEEDARGVDHCETQYIARKRLAPPAVQEPTPESCRVPAGHWSSCNIQ